MVGYNMPTFLIDFISACFPLGDISPAERCRRAVCHKLGHSDTVTGSYKQSQMETHPSPPARDLIMDKPSKASAGSVGSPREEENGRAAKKDISYDDEVRSGHVGFIAVLVLFVLLSCSAIYFHCSPRKHSTYLTKAKRRTKRRCSKSDSLPPRRKISRSNSASDIEEILN